MLIICYFSKVLHFREFTLNFLLYTKPNSIFLLLDNFFVMNKILLFLIFLVGSPYLQAQITFISPFTGNQGGSPLFGEIVPSGGDIFLDWSCYGAGLTDVVGQGSDCRVIVRGMTADSDAESVIASNVVCIADGIYLSDSGNDDVFFANLNVCVLPPGRYSIEIQCDELGGDFDNFRMLTPGP